jgi:hypothetical protein
MAVVMILVDPIHGIHIKDLIPIRDMIQEEMIVMVDLLEVIIDTMAKDLDTAMIYQ